MTIQNIEAEQSVLGALIVDPTIYPKVAQILREDSFFSQAHRTIYKALSGLCSKQSHVDPVTVLHALGSEAKDIGLPYINQLTQSVQSSFGAVRHAKIVAEKALRREIISVAHEAIEKATDDDGDTAEKLSAISAKFASLQRHQMSKAPQVFSDLMVQALDRYQALSEGSGPKAWATGVHALDRMLSGGLRPGKVYGIAARPSVGKSSVARTFAINLGKNRVKTLILSQEMPLDEVADCIIAQIGRVDGSKLMSGELGDDDWPRICEVAEEARDLTLWVDDDGGLTISDIAAKAQQVQGLQVLVLDYLQLSQSTNTKASTNDQVAEISKGLKRLALNLGIAVVVLSQLNRDVEKRADKEPMLSDLRDSGAIEQDLDVALLLWTADETDPSNRLTGWKVAKNRGGRKGKFAMRFFPAVYQWTFTEESLEPQKKSKSWEM